MYTKDDLYTKAEIDEQQFLNKDDLSVAMNEYVKQDQSSEFIKLGITTNTLTLTEQERTDAHWRTIVVGATFTINKTNSGLLEKLFITMVLL